jgi:hypothetical protein
MMNRAIAFSDRQMALLKRTAASLPVTTRHDFLRQVVARLTSPASDYAVQTAINVVLDRISIKQKEIAS